MVQSSSGPADKTEVCVRPELRIIPCGATADTLHATVLLSPLPVGQGLSGIKLNSWPHSVADYLDEIKWTFEVSFQLIPTPTTSIDKCPLIPCSVPACAVPLAVEEPKAKSAFSKAGTRTDLNSLWRASIMRQSGVKVQIDPWANLRDRLKLSSEASFEVGDMGKLQGTTVSYKGDDLGEQGQLPSDVETVGAIRNLDSVIAVPHANLALALDQKRAAELLQSLCEETVHTTVPTGQRPSEATPRKLLDGEVEPTKNMSDAEKSAYFHKADVKAWRLEHLNELQSNVNKEREKAREAYKKASEALEESECKPPEPNSTGFEGLSPSDIADEKTRENEIEKADAVETHASWPQYESEAAKGADSAGDHDQAAQAFFTFQSTPSLARAFLLAIDLKIGLPDGLETGRANFGYLSVKFPGADAGEQLVTLCKLRRQGASWHFWPATMVEMKAAVRGVHDPQDDWLTQRDGVMVMSSGWDCDPAISLPRFDLTCLDLPAAITSNRQRREARKDSATAPMVLRRDEPERKSWSDLDAGATLASAGLTLLQRSAQIDVIGKLAARKFKSSGRPCGAVVTCEASGGTQIVLDADDLTIGTRLVVGRRRADDSTDWRPLMGRQIRFGTTGPTAEKRIVETVLAQLVGPPESAARIALDSAFTTMGNRVLPLPDQRSEIIVDEAYATWDGGPMGVDCAKSSATDDEVEDTLSFGRELSLPEKGGDRPHILRYGHPYRLAQLPVYSGGMSLPRTEMPDDTGGGNPDHITSLLYYPPSCDRGGTTAKVSPYFRMLRHARIGPPVVLLPSGHARRINGPVGTEVARDLVIRSLATQDERSPDRHLTSRAVPDLAQRLILPPTLSFDEAARHGLFDSRIGTQRPNGAFAHLDRNPRTQGFPVTLTRFQRGIEGRQHLLERRIEGESPSSRLHDGETLGDAVWRERGAPGRSSYFPDPATRYLAVRLRIPGHDCTHSIGCYDLWINNQPEVEPRPILLSLEKASAKLAPGLPREVTLPTTRFQPDRMGDIRSVRGRRAFDLRVAQRKGEVFDLDLWFVPDGEGFARDFALAQSLGVHLAARDSSAFASTAKAICLSLRACGLGSVEEAFSKMQLPADSTGTIAYVAPGGKAAPSNGVLKTLGAVIVKRHRSLPLPEIAAVQRLTLTHAVNRLDVADLPKLAQSLLPDLFSASALKNATLADEDGHVPLYARRYGFGRDTLPKPLPEVAESEGETGLVIGGSVEIDFDQVDSIEIWGRMIRPDSALFDDPALGRSIALQQSGTWPLALTSPKKGQPAFRQAESIFGFKLRPDGQVTHTQRDILLLRIDDLVRLPQGGRGKLDLLEYFLQSNNKKQLGRVVHRHQFPDGKARVMCIHVNALCRTAGRMATVDRIAYTGDPWVDPDRSFGFILGDLIESAMLEAVQMEAISKSVRVVMPASVRPAICETRSPLPVFETEISKSSHDGLVRTISVDHRPRLRLPLGRGWYSSGEDERLGIVLWPPRDLGTTSIAGSLPIPGRGRIPLDGFRDADLGPGGRFVSRRGGDPVRAGIAAEAQIFLQASDFRDLDARPEEFGYVDCVPMPFEKPSADQAAPPPMMVALVTAAPRFDPEREEWFVDLDLRPGDAPDSFVRLGLVRYQPHTNLDRRCSVPTVQWAQPLPSRRVIVRPAEGGGLHVSIGGKAPSRRREGSALGLARMTLTVMAEARDSEGRSITREIHRQTIDKPVIPKDHKGPDDWEWIGQVPADVLRRGGVPVNDDRAPTLNLYVEETEFFLPATYEKEPVLPGDIATATPARLETGPRFASKINLGPLMPALGLPAARQSEGAK